MDVNSPGSDYDCNDFCDEEEVDDYQIEEIAQTKNTDIDTTTDSESEDDTTYTGVYQHHQTTKGFGFGSQLVMEVQL